jgi:hypothetical protein
VSAEEESDVIQEPDDVLEEAEIIETFISESPPLNTNTTVSDPPAVKTYAVTPVEVVAVPDVIADELSPVMIPSPCGEDRDGKIPFASFVHQYVYDSPPAAARASATPPVRSGAPHATDNVSLSFILGDVVGEYDFRLTQMNTDPDQNLVTFYLIADTGETGLFASDICVTYDSSAMQFVGVNTIGSIFSYTEQWNDAEAIHFRGITHDAFIGTQGYVAAFQFSPVREGNASLIFRDVALYQADTSASIALAMRDIQGVFMRSLQSADSEASDSIGSGAPKETRSTAWILRIMFFILACGASIAATYTLSKKTL